MSHWEFLQHRTARLILISQLACMVALVALIAQAWRPQWTIIDASLIVAALTSAAVTTYGAWALFSSRRSTDFVERTAAERQERSVTLEPAAVPHSLQLEEALAREREMRRRLMEADRLVAIGELVAGVAHEVNNPLSSISAFAQLLLRDGGLSPAQRESIEVIKSETARASQVVKDLLVFARRSEPQRESVDLNSLVERILRLRGYDLMSSQITVEHALAPDLPPVIGDARQLQHVCLNLVTNAILAMSGRGGGMLSVTTRPEGNDVVLEVRDTGSAIPLGERVHIVEASAVTMGKSESTGMGLSVSYGIIAAHGGSIEVAETTPAGTLVRIALPAAEARSVDA